MGLLGQSGAPVGTPVGAGMAHAVVPPVVEEKKKSNAYEYQKKMKAKQREGAQRILANPDYKFDAVDKAFLEWLNKEPGTRDSGGFGTPIFNKLYGTEPKVGDSITLQFVFDTCYKGKGQMDSLMKKWREKNGVEIDFVFNKEKPALSTYTIKALPAKA
jgi:hypothetical protein